MKSYVGLAVSDTETNVGVTSERGKILWQGKVFGSHPVAALAGGAW